MIKKFATIGIMTAATIAFAGAVQAQVAVPKNQEFTAVPLQHGAPTDLPGERLIPGASQIAVGVDTILRPVIVDPIQGIGVSVGAAVGGVAPAAPAAAAPAKKKRFARRHVAKKRLAKKRA